SGRSSLVAALQLPALSDLADQLPHRLWAIRNGSPTADFSAFRLRDHHRNRIGMDIQTYKAYFGHKRPTPFVCGSAPRGFTSSQRNPRLLRIGGWSPPW